MYYAGIGSRETPENICRQMYAAARNLYKLRFILRSGGAKGADESFENGADYAAANQSSTTNIIPYKEIYLPYKGFRKNQSDLFGSCKEARLIARKYHPNWQNVSSRGWDYLSRNVYQILGKNLQTPSSFVLCWTKEGAFTGGTGSALRIAEDYKIPIFNFATHDLNYISDAIFEYTKGTTQ